MIAPSWRRITARQDVLVITTAAVALFVALSVYLPFVQTYVPKGDDFGLLLNSAHQYDPSPLKWITDGFRYYSINYPELHERGTHWIRPTLNSSVYLESLIAGSPSSRLMLFTNYVGHAVGTALVLLVAMRVFLLRRGAALLAAALFFGTTSATSDLADGIAYRGDMLATVFSLAALLATAAYVSGRRRLSMLAAIAVCLTLAVFAKEAAAATPLLLLLYVVFFRWNASPDGRFRHVVTNLVRHDKGIITALAAPAVAYTVARGAAGLGDNYALSEFGNEIFGIPIAFLNPLRFVATAFFPVETSVFKRLLTAPGSIDGQFALEVARAVLAMALNVAGWIAVAAIVSRRAFRRDGLQLLGLALAASALPIVLKADPRFMYLSQSLVLPLLVWALVRLRGVLPSRYSSRTAAAIGVSVLLAIGPVYFVLDGRLRQPELVAENDTANALRVAVIDELRDPTIHRLYLLNVPEVASPGLQALRFWATEVRRNGVDLRVVNSLTGQDDERTARDEGVRFRLTGAKLRVDVTVGREEFFGGAVPEPIGGLGVPGIIEYGPLRVDKNRLGRPRIEQRVLTFWIPNAKTREDYAIVGLDPAEGGVHVYRPGETEWRRGA